MPVSTFTTAFMRALPAPLRPNPYNVDEYVMTAITNGWETDDLAKMCYVNERNPNPAFVVMNLKNLSSLPPHRETTRRAWGYGHIKCTDPYHPVGCQICRCIPGEDTHHVSTPMPDNMRGAFSRVARRVADA